jgi:hypothetical protein
LTKLPALTLLLLGCAGSPRERLVRGEADSLPVADAREAPAVAFRVPADGGPVTAYSLPELAPLPRRFGTGTSRPRAALGVDLAGRRLVYRDSAGAVTAFDLVASRERPIAPRGALAALASDGTVLTVDSRGSVVEALPWGNRPWPGSLGRNVREVFAAPGPRLIALRDAEPDSLLVTSREAGVTLAEAVPDAADRAASVEGDAIAFATDSGVVVLEEREPDRPWFVALTGRPRAVIFSPSGHRLYVALRDQGELAVVDRFTRRVREAVTLPGPAAELRFDPWGRALFARAAGEGEDRETWVIGTARSEVTGRLATRWGSDLPAVSESGVLLSREDDALVARDLRSLDSLSATEADPRDLWFSGRWTQPAATAAARQIAARADTARRTPARAAQPTAPAASRAATPPPAPAAPSTPPPPSLWVQVSVSRNETWARALAAELSEAGHPAVVVPPRGEGDGWRVMTGPFRSRDVADSAGRALGRPYWVVDRTREAPRP